MDFSKLPDLLAQLFSKPADDFRNDLAQYSQDKQLLRNQVMQQIEMRIAVLSANSESKLQKLWQIVALAQKTTDVRRPLLEGYRALVELNATKLASAIDQTRVAIKDAAPWEVENSILTLTSSARRTLGALHSIQDLLSEKSQTRKGFEQSIMGQIQSVSKSANGIGQLAWLSSSIFKFFGGGPGAESALESSINDLLNEHYLEFMTVLEKAPDFGATN
jgi:hypothetical protein